jgi:hypothetical protein
LPALSGSGLVWFDRQGNGQVEIEVTPFNTADGLAGVEVLQVARFKGGKTIRELAGVKPWPFTTSLNIRLCSSVLLPVPLAPMAVSR